MRTILEYKGKRKQKRVREAVSGKTKSALLDLVKEHMYESWETADSATVREAQNNLKVVSDRWSMDAMEYNLSTTFMDKDAGAKRKSNFVVRIEEESF